jgi:hypothetical protein
MATISKLKWTHLQQVGIQTQNKVRKQSHKTCKRTCISAKTSKIENITFWNFKSPKKDLRLQNLGFIPNPQIKLNLFTLKLVHN